MPSIHNQNSSESTLLHKLLFPKDVLSLYKVNVFHPTGGATGSAKRYVASREREKEIKMGINGARRIVYNVCKDPASIAFIAGLLAIDWCVGLILRFRR